MKLEVNISKSRFFVLLAMILLFGGAIAVYAYNTQKYQNPTTIPIETGYKARSVLRQHPRRKSPDRYGGIET